MIKELLHMLFFQSDEDRQEEYELEHKRLNKHKTKKAIKQSFTEDVRALTMKLKEAN